MLPSSVEQRLGDTQLSAPLQAELTQSLESLFTEPVTAVSRGVWVGAQRLLKVSHGSGWAEGWKAGAVQ